MAAPTAIAYNRDCGPVQRLVGSATFATAATDAYTAPSVGDAVIVLGSGVLTLTLGFVPTHVKIINTTTRIMTEWFPPIASGTSIDTGADGVRTLNTSSKITVTSRTGAGGSSTQSGGSADTTPAGVVALTLSGFATNADSIVWAIEG